MSATARFYTVFFIVLAAIIALSYWLGYRAGASDRAHVAARHATVPASAATP